MRMRRVFPPLGVFLAVLAIHGAWTAHFPEAPLEQARWVSLGPDPQETWLDRYIATQDYWLGISYALSLSFAAAAFRRYREERSCTARNIAVGGVTVTGVLAVVGCFLVGCCGSPMLAVYASLLGAAFVPLMKPLLAGLTAVSVTAAWIWMNRSSRGADPVCEGGHCGSDG